MAEFISKSVSDTEAVATKVAQRLQGGDWLALVGNLGAGKTVFVKGLARALGVSANLTSPTFVLLKAYDTGHKVIKKFVHVDCYRLDGKEDLMDIGLSDYLNQKDTVVVIEWADKIRGLPDKTIKINIDYRPDNQRKILVDNLNL
ncbi:MAG: tRNA (adenosine(37)-N6)-threonylcarbamoyltransferase complex ATPase subunit type 1 TsaE [Parcubacteria group bacterium]|nr:MAG: tRNA (adenosine(37)-N6)-threonylcarbamoyltransferase complex ATPase subunit type 1 TsaE [Parcubacteria group bacterium]